jgi:hypothetical protein
MDTIQIFLDFFRHALTRVNNDYYGLNWWNESMLNAVIGPEQNEQRTILQEYLERYGERVFCYELYHQVRTLMDEHAQNHPHTFRNIKLQSELKKDYIGQIVADYFGVQALDSEYIPDFLLHSPGNFDNQHLIIEVKSNPKLAFSGMTDDLLKIQQFINRYQYEKGVFLTINTNPKRISSTLVLDTTKDWFRHNINTPDKIHIMCKKKNDVDLYEQTIEQILA